MDISESTKIVFDRIQKIEPELVSKIVGYLLLKEHGDREMIRLAFGPDNAIHALINEARTNLSAVRLSPKPVVSAPVQHIADFPMKLASHSPNMTCPISSPGMLDIPSPYWNTQFNPGKEAVFHNIEYIPQSYSGSISKDHQLYRHETFVDLKEHMNHGNPVPFDVQRNYCQKSSFGADLSSRTWKMSNIQDFPAKVCHYFYKGYCKHGINCSYYHDQSALDGCPQLYSPNSNDIVNKDHIISAISLEEIEIEIKELLKSRGGQQISIAMLPNIYYERYGKVLAPDGYLTESQRHGKAGYSLTKLLAQLSSSIRLIERPHGQHSIILAEDAPAHLGYRNDRSEPGSTVFGSHQIYLTFPADSTFTEDDLSNYFKKFGPVHAVRIPAQLKRMFGFVAFVYPETVKLVLMNRSPHYVCGCRVLVKPYREKFHGSDRKYSDKLENQMAYPSQQLETDPGFHSELSGIRMHEEHQLTLELQRKQLSALTLASCSSNQKPYFAFSMEETSCHDVDHSSSQSGALYNGNTGENKNEHESNNCIVKQSNSLPVGTDITAYI